MSKIFDHLNLEPKIYNRWEKSNVFSCNPESKKKPYTIMMPPPNVTGSLHIGHALNMTLQDILARYWRMKGLDVLWQPGTDHAGIATQIVVEQNLAENSQPGRIDLGREKFIEKIWEWKNDYGSKINSQLKRLGASPDWSREKFTLDKSLSKAVNKVFVNLYKDGLIYKDKRLVNWDVKLGTAVSDLEVIQKEVKGKFYFIEYPFLDLNKHIVVATTRPETMLGDVCIAVNPDDKRYTNYIGKQVLLPLTKKKITILADEFVDKEKGTGAVKITPAHDFNDFLLGRRHGYDPIDIFNPNATLNENVPEKYRGLERFEARKIIIEDLDKIGLVEKIKDTMHFVPYGDRSNTVLEPRLTDQWFLNCKPLADLAIDSVKENKTEFIPKNWEKTFFNWMENIEPWCISRQLWWGHQLPVWYGPDFKVFVEETEQQALAAALNFYGKSVSLTRDPDVLDTWFSSGLWPFTTLGWPKEKKMVNRYYPGSVLVTGFDIIFFWVARMMMQGIYNLENIPFDKVYVHALVRDEQGNKMSKSKGNVIDPISLLDKFGADALRFTLSSLAVQGRDIKLSEERIKGYRNFVTKIWNANNFIINNNCSLKSDFEIKNVKNNLNVWILEGSFKAIKLTGLAIENFKFSEASSILYNFFWHTYCDWYLEFAKSLLSSSYNDETVSETKTVCCYVFQILLKAIHPIMPFISEILNDSLSKKENIIINEEWPEIDYEIDKNEEKTNEASWLIKLITEIRSVKSSLNIPKKAEIDLAIRNASQQTSFRFKNYFPILQKIINLNEIIEESNISEKYAHFVLEGTTIILPLENLIDIDKEHNRLELEITRLKKEVSYFDKKLSNKDFVKRAPKDVINLQRQKKLEVKKKLDIAVEAISRLEV